MVERPDDVTEDVSEDGWHILRGNQLPTLLQVHYAMYNKQCFDGQLPTVPVLWAKSITQPDGNRANAVYISGDAVLKRPQYIAIDEGLCGMFPLERLCLLHEIVHVKIGPELGHGEEFVAEFRRVLDANKWEVMGCIDSPPPTPKVAATS